jgi:Secretion system C-terminal sorting domain
MKKILQTSVLALASICYTNAQTILNADFAQTTATDVLAGTYTNWTGSAFASTLVNGGNNNGAMLKSLVSNLRERVCVQFGIDKATGNQICLQYSISNTYTVETNTLSQAVALTAIPQKVTGKFKYSSNVGNLNAALILEGNYNGQRFQDTLILDNSTQGIAQELPIGKNYLPCIISGSGGGEGGIIVGRIAGKGDIDNCPVKNSIEIKLVSCLNCPTLLTTTSTNLLVVDDLQLVNVVSSVFDAEATQELGFYPNPASTQVTVSEFSEVLDLQGNTVAQGIGKIDISGLNNGLYIIKSEKGTNKLIKE